MSIDIEWSGNLIGSFYFTAIWNTFLLKHVFVYKLKNYPNNKICFWATLVVDSESPWEWAGETYYSSRHNCMNSKSCGMHWTKARRGEMKSIMQIYKTKKLINTFKHFMKTVFDSYRCPFKKVCDTTQLCLDGRLTCHNGENLDNQFPRTEPRISNWLQLKQSLISGKVQKVQILVFFYHLLCVL